MSAAEPRRAGVGFQAARSVHAQPQSQGCAQLRPLPAGLQRPRRQIPGRGAAAAGVPPEPRHACALPGGATGFWGVV